MRVREALPEEAHRVAFDELIVRTPGRVTFATKVELLAGVRPSPAPIATYPWDVIGEAMSDLAQTARPVTHLPGFCRVIAARRAGGPLPDETLAAAASRLFLEAELHDAALREASHVA